MSDGSPGNPPGPGWWLASDGNWYPPDQTPGYAPQPTLPPPVYGGSTAGYGYGYPMQPQATGTNGYAIASLIASIVSCGIGSILGVIFGHIALSQMKSSSEGGRGLAVAGLIIGYIGIVVIVVAVIFILAGGDESRDFEFQIDSIVRSWTP